MGLFVEIFSNSLYIVEIMSQVKLDNQGKPGSTGRPFLPIVGLLNRAHPRSRLAGFEPRTYQSRARALNR